MRKTYPPYYVERIGPSRFRIVDDVFRSCDSALYVGLDRVPTNLRPNKFRVAYTRGKYPLAVFECKRRQDAERIAAALLILYEITP